MIYVIILSSALCAMALPSIFILIRESTKVHRQGIVQDLIRVFDRGGKPGASSIPSFEFVKYKYFIGDRINKSGDPPRDDFRIYHWVLSTLPLVGITFVLNVLCLAIVIHASLRWSVPVDIAWLDGRVPLPLFVWVVLASYVGAMLFMLTRLIRSRLIG